MSVKILIIEDEPDIRRNLEYNLGREGFNAYSVGTLDKAYKKIKSKKLLQRMILNKSYLEM